MYPSISFTLKMETTAYADMMQQFRIQCSYRLDRGHENATTKVMLPSSKYEPWKPEA
jgi:hypothetical protein